MLVVCSLNVPRVDVLLDGSILLTVPYWEYCLSLGLHHACGTRDVCYDGCGNIGENSDSASGIRFEEGEFCGGL